MVLSSAHENDFIVLPMVYACVAILYLINRHAYNATFMHWYLYTYEN